MEIKYSARDKDLLIRDYEERILRLQLKKINENTSKYDEAIENNIRKLKEAKPVVTHHWNESSILRAKAPVGNCLCSDGKTRLVWEDDLHYYTWDTRHGEVEMFDKNKLTHKDAIDPNTGAGLNKQDDVRYLKTINRGAFKI